MSKRTQMTQSVTSMPTINQNVNSMPMRDKPLTMTEQAQRFIPKYRMCPKCDSEPYLRPRAPLPSDKYCSHCGSELEDKVGDLYVILDRTPHSPDYFETNHESKCPQPPQAGTQYPSESKAQEDSRTTITLRQLIVLMKEYEKEMVIEGL